MTEANEAKEIHAYMSTGKKKRQKFDPQRNNLTIELD